MRRNWFSQSCQSHTIQIMSNSAIKTAIVVLCGTKMSPGEAEVERNSPKLPRHCTNVVRHQHGVALGCNGKNDGIRSSVRNEFLK